MKRMRTISQNQTDLIKDEFKMHTAQPGTGIENESEVKSLRNEDDQKS